VERVEPASAQAREEEERGLECPWCGSDDVERVSEYGQHLMVAQYICRACHSPFERIKR